MFDVVAAPDLAHRAGPAATRHRIRHQPLSPAPPRFSREDPAGECSGVGWPAAYTPLTVVAEGAVGEDSAPRSPPVFPVNPPRHRGCPRPSWPKDAIRDDIHQPPRIGINVPLTPNVVPGNGPRTGGRRAAVDGADRGRTVRQPCVCTWPGGHFPETTEIYVYGKCRPLRKSRGPVRGPSGPESTGEFWTASVGGRHDVRGKSWTPEGRLSGTPLQIDQVAYFYRALDGLGRASRHAGLHGRRGVLPGVAGREPGGPPGWPSTTGAVGYPARAR